MHPMLFILIVIINFAISYKPVILIHGIMTGSGSMEMIGHRIKEVSISLLFQFIKISLGCINVFFHY